MPTGINGPFSFTTRDYYDNNGDTNAAYGDELSWEQLDTTLLFLSGAIAGIPTGIAEVIVGPSASGAPNNLIGSSSGDVTGSIQEGTVWVVAGDTNDDANGLSYIFDTGQPSPGYGTWYPLELNIPLPFVRIYSASRQDITSSLLISGSEVIFSSSLFWSGSSQAAANSTAYTVVLSSSGQLYVTGAYGGGGNSTNFVKAGAIAPSAFSGTPSSSAITFVTPMATANYGVSVIGGDARSWTIDSKTVNGFTINSNSIVALTTSASWIAAPANNP